jgi:WhiB family redox-sensing transcriptional regulator
LEGLCRQVDQDLWFPHKGDSNNPAKRICNGARGFAPCPVRDLCLEYALTNAEAFGVWGGMGERERSAILKKRRAA